MSNIFVSEHAYPTLATWGFQARIYDRCIHQGREWGVVRYNGIEYEVIKQFGHWILFEQ